MTVERDTLMQAQLEFDPTSHRYTLNGQVLPSVTQVLEDVGVIDYSGIPWDTRQMALTRGSNVHLATQLDDEGDLDEASAGELMGYVQAWRAARAHLKLERFEAIERRMAHSQFLFAGTTDRETRDVIIDLKTNEAPWWVRIQLAAYQCLAEANSPDGMFPRTITRRIAVELHPDATFKIFEFGAREYRDDLQTFLAALRVRNEKQMNRRERKW